MHDESSLFVCQLDVLPKTERLSGSPTPMNLASLRCPSVTSAPDRGRARQEHGDAEVHPGRMMRSMPDGRQGRGSSLYDLGMRSVPWRRSQRHRRLTTSRPPTVGGCGLLPRCTRATSSPASTPPEKKGATSPQKQQQGLTDLSITSRYKIGSSELFDFTGRYQGKPAKGAATQATTLALSHASRLPRFHLPPTSRLVRKRSRR